MFKGVPQLEPGEVRPDALKFHKRFSAGGVPQGLERLHFDLPDAFPCEGVGVSDFLQGLGLGTVQSEAADKNVLFLGQLGVVWVIFGAFGARKGDKTSRGAGCEPYSSRPPAVEGSRSEHTSEL